MVTKQCPNCQKHVPVACKKCPCGHVFFVTRGSARLNKAEKNEEGEIKRRRTERTKRERPDYFNSLKIDNQLKKRKRKPNTRKKSDTANEKEGSYNSEGSEATNQPGTSKSKKRGRPKKSLKDKADSKETKEEEVDMHANLSKEQQERFSLVLSEINRKMFQQYSDLD